MRQPEVFDAFYLDARERLLTQCFALTGDLAASRRAVRDAFVVAWHHWRRLQRLDDPELSVRPHAWRLALRYHTARVWHRDKDVDADVRATLDALGKLSAPQRQALVLTQFATVSMEQMAREIGLPPEEAARELQAGAAQLALAREVPTAALPQLFAQLTAWVSRDAEPVAGRPPRWPRSPIVRRAGARRRRLHTAAGAAGLVALTAVAGLVLTDKSGARPTLDRVAATPGRGAPAPTAAPVQLTPATLVTDTQVSDALDGGWRVGSTSDNSSGSGRLVPCQGDRYADRTGEAALARILKPSGSGSGSAGSRVVQLTEQSDEPDRAEQTYETTVDWYAGCSGRRVQLLATRTPSDVGDESVQLVLRSYDAPVRTLVVGIARTGVYTTTTVTEERGSALPDRTGAARVLADAVNGLCHLQAGGACAPARPDLVDRDPVPVGSPPGLLAPVDLPPVSGVDAPWDSSGADRLSGTNLAATGCDKSTFRGEVGNGSFTKPLTSTFLITTARPALPDTFGLTETVATLPSGAAKAFVAKVRTQLGSCPDRLLGSQVTRLTDTDGQASTGGAGTSVAAWKVRVQVSDQKQVGFWMAILRHGDAVGQVGFVPAPGVSMASADFVALAERAAQRLGSLPGAS